MKGLLDGRLAGAWLRGTLDVLARYEPWLAGWAALLLYLRSLLHGVHDFGDITKAQFLGRLLGMTHPTGYPLYALLTAPLARVPVGELATRINAFSALCGAGAVALLVVAARGLGVRPGVASIAAAAFAVSRVAWSQFVIAEVYALNALLVAGVLVLLLRWLEYGTTRLFLAAAALYALSFGNHLTVVTLLPAFALATVLGPWRRLARPAVVASVVGFVLLGAAQYAYLFWASASRSLYLEYRVDTFAELVEFVSGERYRSVMFAFGWRELLTDRLPRFGAQLLRDLGPLALLAPVGAAALARRGGACARGLAVLLVAALGQLFWVLEYDIPDIEVYTIPLAWLTSLAVAVALDALAGPVAARRALVLAPSLALIGAMALVHFPTHAKARRFARDIERDLATMGQDAALVGRIHYSPRMAFVYHLYALGLSRERRLHLVYEASPGKVVRHLSGQGKLVDSHSRARVPSVARLYVDSRGRRQDWGPDVEVVSAGGGLYELRLR